MGIWNNMGSKGIYKLRNEFKKSAVADVYRLECELVYQHLFVSCDVSICGGELRFFL